MEKDKIFEQIKKDYPDTRWVSSTCIQINFMDFMLDPYNFAFVCLLFEDDKMILTDFADNEEVFEFPIEKYKEICAKHNITWNDYHFECIYNSNDDIKRYKECLEELAEYNFKLKYPNYL